MKFETRTFWKHVNCMDVFLAVFYVVHDNGVTASVSAEWMVQGHEIYGTAPVNPRGDNLVRVDISAEEYDNWKPYDPIGRYVGS